MLFGLLGAITLSETCSDTFERLLVVPGGVETPRFPVGEGVVVETVEARYGFEGL